MIPAFVVPDVATTAAIDPGSPSASMAARSALPVSRWSSVSTVSGSISRIRSVLMIEECASAPTATRHRWPGWPASPALRLATSRATTSADRFPAEPPDTKHPPADGGSPARSAIRRSTWFSAWIAPAASSQEMPWIEAHEISMSNSSDALVGAAGMKPRKRGLSAEITAGARHEVYTPSTWSGLCGWSPSRPFTAASSAAGSRSPSSSGTGSSRSRFSAYASTDLIICSVVASTLCIGENVDRGRAGPQGQASVARRYDG